MNESEQAQTIAEIKRLMKTFGATVTYSYADMHTAISLVDSQAQKIAQLTKERDDARKCAEDFRDDEYDNDNDVDLSIAENRIARREYAKAHPLPWEKQ